LIQSQAPQPRSPLARLGLGLGLALFALACAAEDLIVHQGLSLNQIDRNDARLYFTMRLKTWPDGTPVKVFVLPDDNPLHHKVVTDIVGLYPHQLRRAWDRQLFSGTGQAPVTVTTEQELVARVAATPGAVGYATSASGLPGVRPLKVR
jgi:hypothetical protein